MTKMLSAANALPRLIAPGTTRTLAQRMLSASAEIAAALPRGFYAPTALDILLTLYIAEDDARYLVAAELHLPGGPPTGVVERWLTALAAEGLLDRQGELLALSAKGYDLVTAIVEAIHAAQRTLDVPCGPAPGDA